MERGGEDSWGIASELELTASSRESRSVDAMAMALQLQALPSFQALSSLPAPQQPALAEDLDPPPLLPALTLAGDVLPVSLVLNDRADGRDRRASAESEGPGALSMESRRSFFSESFPDATMKPPNRLLHDRHMAKMDKMLQEPSSHLTIESRLGIGVFAPRYFALAASLHS